MTKTMKVTGDKTLVKMYMTGDDIALAELIRRHKDKVFTSILLFVKDETLAEDIFQDTFIKVIELYAEENIPKKENFCRGCFASPTTCVLTIIENSNAHLL